MHVKFYLDPLRFGGVIREKPILSKYILRCHAYMQCMAAYNNTENIRAMFMLFRRARRVVPVCGHYVDFKRRPETLETFEFVNSQQCDH